MSYQNASKIQVPFDATVQNELNETFLLKQEISATSTEIQELGAKRLKYEKMFLSLILVATACLFIHFAIILIAIRMQFGDLISYIDNDVVAIGKTKTDPSEQRKYYNYTDGYSIAFYYKFPGLPMNPFLNTAFPASIVFSYYTPQYSNIFLKDPTLVQQMYIYSVIGSLNECGTQDPTTTDLQQTCAIEPSAHQIICATYGTNAGFKDCKQACQKDTSLGTMGLVGQMVAMGSLGAFAGAMTGKGMANSMNSMKGYGEGAPGQYSEVGMGMGFGAVYAGVGLTMGVVTSEMSKGANAQYQQSISAGYCEQPGT